MFKSRLFYFLCFFLLLVIEICIAAFLDSGFVRNYVGDFLVVILIYCFIRSILNTRPLQTAIFTLVFAYSVEILQYFSIVHKLNLQNNNIAKIIIGTSFEWADIIAYTIGIISVLAIERLCTKKAFVQFGLDN